MAPLQKEVYRSILSECPKLGTHVLDVLIVSGKNLETLSGLTKTSIQNAPKGRINNILMQLRK